MQNGPAALWFILGTTALLGAGAVQAASCREALEQFEDRLNESSLATDEPEKFSELARAAEEAAELRDEQQCLERAAELNAAIEVEEPVPAEAATQSNAAPATPAPPKPPVLLRATPDDEAAATADPPDSGTVGAGAQATAVRQQAR